MTPVDLSLKQPNLTTWNKHFGNTSWTPALACVSFKLLRFASDRAHPDVEQTLLAYGNSKGSDHDIQRKNIRRAGIWSNRIRHGIGRRQRRR
jgi:hypothetical protein